MQSSQITTKPLATNLEMFGDSALGEAQTPCNQLGFQFTHAPSCISAQSTIAWGLFKKPDLSLDLKNWQLILKLYNYQLLHGSYSSHPDYQALTNTQIGTKTEWDQFSSRISDLVKRACTEWRAQHLNEEIPTWLVALEHPKAPLTIDALLSPEYHARIIALIRTVLRTYQATETQQTNSTSKILGYQIAKTEAIVSLGSNLSQLTPTERLTRAFDQLLQLISQNASSDTSSSKEKLIGATLVLIDFLGDPECKQFLPLKAALTTYIKSLNGSEKFDPIELVSAFTHTWLSLKGISPSSPAEQEAQSYLKRLGLSYTNLTTYNSFFATLSAIQPNSDLKILEPSKHLAQSDAGWVFSEASVSSGKGKKSKKSGNTSSKGSGGPGADLRPGANPE